MNENLENANDKDEAALTKAQWTWIIVTFLLVLGLFGLNYYWLNNNANKGIMGDQFGVVNALFSGLAFGGIIFTILLQRNELQLQRKEIKQTRNEFILQNYTLRLQRFENTFFSMLNLQHQIIEGMVRGSHKGREHIDDTAGYLMKFLTNQNAEVEKEAVKTNDEGEKLKKTHEITERNYHSSYYKEFEPFFNHYFRHLYHIYKFIYFSDFLTKEQKDFYASLVRAQLSQNELFLIAYNGIIEYYGYPKFAYLIKEFAVLKNFRYDVLTQSHQWNMIQKVMAEVEYPFSQKKPEVRNID